MADTHRQYEAGRLPDFDRGPGSAALAIAMRTLLPQSQLCIMDGGPCRSARAALLVSNDGPCWLDATGLHDARTEPFDQISPIRIAGRAEVVAMLNGQGETLAAMAEQFLAKDDLIRASLTRAEGLSGKPEWNMDGIDGEGLWERIHPSAPPGGGAGWQTLSEIFNNLAEILEFDDEDFEWFEELSSPEQVGSLYGQPLSADFAAALHRMTGWPMVTVTFPGEDEVSGHHAFVLGPDGRYLDAAGWHTRSEVRQSFGGNRVRFGMPCGEDDVMSVSNIGRHISEGENGNGIDAHLALTVSAIRQLPWAPFGEPGFQALSMQEQIGVETPLPGTERVSGPFSLN